MTQSSHYTGAIQKSGNV